jgi:hypothetical protein
LRWIDDRRDIQQAQRGLVAWISQWQAQCVETHEAWLEDSRYLNMMPLAEQKKEVWRLAA